MAYVAWSVVFGETPSASKWNILGTNDSSFNDGSGLNNIQNPIVAASTSHIELTPGTSKFVKIATLRQDDTTNSYKNKTVILHGNGVMAYPAAAAVSENITFGITFDQRPDVIAGLAGDAATNLGYGLGGNTVEGRLCIKNFTQSTTGFTVMIHTAGGTNFAAGFGYYTWIAIGELTA